MHINALIIDELFDRRGSCCHSGFQSSCIFKWGKNSCTCVHWV